MKNSILHKIQNKSFYQITAIAHLMNSKLLEGWLTINKKLRYCYLKNGKLEISHDEKHENPEYSFYINKIVDIIGSNNEDFILLPQNLPQLHFMSEDINNIQKWKHALFENNKFEYFHQNIQKISNFEPIREIGEGYCGKVYLVRRKTDKKLLALKLISKDKLTKEESIERAIIERNIMIQNNFPFITKIHSAFQTETHLIYTLEYIGGGDLQYHLDKNLYLTPRQIKLYLAELVLTLEHLHKMGILFRDLKPSNILIAKDGHLKLTDFGLSVSIIETEKTNTLCGTHDYLSPEMLNGIPYSYSVDWWALGVIAYRLICGNLPFCSQNLTRLYDKIIDCEYRIPLRIDQVSRDFISGLLKKDPNDRLNIEQIKSHKFFADIDWQKVYKKEYKMDFVPYVDDTNCAYNFKKYENDNQFNDCCSLSSNNSNSDLYNESDISFIKNFSFSSSDADFDF